MARKFTWRDEAGDPLTGSLSLAGTRGIAGSPLVLQLTNDGTGAEREIRVRGFFGDHGALELVRTGHEFSDRHFIEARIVEGLNGIVVGEGGWRSLGAGSFLPIPALEAGEGVVIEVRDNTPGDLAGLDAATVALKVTAARYEPLGVGSSEVAGDGILLPLGDADFWAHVSGADVVENPAGADAQVQVGRQTWVAEGLCWTKATHLVALNGNDKNSAALASGEAYYALLSLGSGGLVTVTKSAKSSALVASDKPNLPENERPLCYVVRQFDGLINEEDIENVWREDLFSFSSAGLVASIAAGPHALVDNAIVYSATEDNLTLAASSTSTIFLLPDGNYGVTTDGSKPAARALPLWEATTDGTEVTSARDLRHFVGFQEQEIVFTWTDSLVASTYRYAHVPRSRPVQILPVGGATVSVGVQATGTPTGVTAFGLEYYHGGSWLDILDIEPEIAASASGAALVSAASPGVHQIPAMAPVRAWISQIPAGGSADPKHATLVVRCAA